MANIANRKEQDGYDDNRDQTRVDENNRVNHRERSLRLPEVAEVKPLPPKQHINHNSLSTFKTQSITKHYALNNQILAAFDSLYSQNLFKGAYAFGIQFVEVALLEIPKHGYFYSSRHKQERLENSENALRVTQQLQLILEELKDEASESDWERVNKLRRLAEEQASEQHLLEAYERDRQEVEWELSQTSASLCADIMEYAELILPVPVSSQGASTKTTSSATSLTLNDSGRTGEFATASILQSSASTVDTPLTQDEIQRALFVSGIAASDASSPSRPPADTRRHRSATAIEITSLQLCYHEDFEDLRNQGRVRVSRADTYQGRLPGSINGCTVIAPLLCLHHFHNWDDGADHGLPDPAICEIIDKETPAILPEVRSNLGLTKDALIIPSDVHDFLIDKQLISSEQFVSVVGGNILDDAHLSEFVNHLLHTNDQNTKFQGKKVASTFYFHEHVVAILKLRRYNSDVWFDLIDSLPNQETIRRVYQDVQDDFVPKTCRIRCVDKEALKATLRWYACSRFTDENKQYIDLYEWDENYSDFDPRVFQAFIWAEMV